MHTARHLVTPPHTTTHARATAQPTLALNGVSYALALQNTSKYSTPTQQHHTCTQAHTGESLMAKSASAPNAARTVPHTQEGAQKDLLDLMQCRI
eukprot:366432-Chlamydomonas_euryale.AAC.11